MSINEKLKILSQPFPAKRVSWRVGSVTKDNKKGQALPYIDARCVQDRLDEAVGPGGWNVEFKPSPLGNGVTARIGIYVDGQWIYKEDGTQLDNVSETDKRANAAEIAIKGAYSDALKRAAVMWGIGRYLYEYEPQWVELNDYKQLKQTPSLPAHMLPAGSSSPVSTNRPSQPAASPAKEAPIKQEPAKQESTTAAEPKSATVTPMVDPTVGINTAEFPQGLTEVQANKIKEMIQKIGQADSATMRTYLNSDSAKKLYPQNALNYVLNKIDEFEKKAA